MHHIIFNDYSILRHMPEEHERKRSVNKDELKYYCERIGFVGQKKIKNSNNKTKNISKSNEANVNVMKNKKVERKT